MEKATKIGVNKIIDSEKINICEIAAKVIAKKYRYDWEDLRQEAWFLLDGILEKQIRFKGHILKYLKLRLIDFLRSEKHPGTRNISGCKGNRKKTVNKQSEQIKKTVEFEQKNNLLMLELKIKIKSIGGAKLIKKRLEKNELIYEMKEYFKNIKMEFDNEN